MVVLGVVLDTLLTAVDVYPTLLSSEDKRMAHLFRASREYYTF